MDQSSDSSLIELAQGGDQRAFAELYTRYFDPVFDFVARITRDRHEAEDIAQDTFLKAMNALGGLQKGASFKSWIFTIARNTALTRIEKKSRVRPLTYENEDGEETGFDVVDTDRFSNPEEAAQASAVASLVWQAAAGLDPRQLSLLDLHLRQGLDSGEIADVLGVTKNNGYVMLNRLKKAVEDAIGAFIMFKDGRQHCGELDAVLIKGDVQGMSPEARKLVERHVAQCPNCEERKKKLAPLAAFAAFGAIGAPAGAKAHILEGLMQQWPGPALPTAPGGTGGTGGGGAAGGGSGGMFGSAGGFLKAGAGLGAAAALLLLALLVPASPLALTRGGSDDTVSAGPGETPPGGASAVPTGAATATATPSRGAAGSPSPTGSLTPPPNQVNLTPTATPTRTNTPAPTPGLGTPTFTPSPVPSNTPTPTRTSTPASTPVPPTSTPLPPTPTPCVPALFANTSTVNIALGGSSSFVLSNSAACTTSFTISGDGAPWLSYTPPFGSIGPSSQSSIGLGVNAALVPPAEGTYSSTLTIFGGPNPVYVTVSTSRTNAAPQVFSASGVCNSGTLPTTTFTVSASDDVSVVSVVVYWTDSGGAARQFSLSGPSGSSWTGTTSLPTRNGSNFRAIASDGAKSTQLSFSKPC